MLVLVTQQPMQAMPPPTGPTGWLALTVQGSSLTSNMIAPTVLLNGYRVPAHYGENLYPVPAGPWHIDIHCNWLRQYGEATLDCNVAEGQTVPVFYAPPYHMFRDGELGHERLQRKGRVGFALSLTAAAVVVVIAILVQLI